MFGPSWYGTVPGHSDGLRSRCSYFHSNRSTTQAHVANSRGHAAAEEHLERGTRVVNNLLTTTIFVCFFLQGAPAHEIPPLSLFRTPPTQHLSTWDSQFNNTHVMSRLCSCTCALDLWQVFFIALFLQIVCRIVAGRIIPKFRRFGSALYSSLCCDIWVPLVSNGGRQVGVKGQKAAVNSHEVPCLI